MKTELKEKFIKFMVESFCRHVYKEGDSEFLEKEIKLNYNDHQVDIDCYDKFAVHMNCLKCTATKIDVHNQLIKKVDVTDMVTTWKREDNHE